MILSIDEVGEILEGLMAELPPQILEGLNGGVCLREEEMRPRGPDGETMVLLGEYFAGGAMGCYVNIYYGSFAARFAHSPRRVWEKQLRQTLHHELTHHLERRAGCRDLEIEDELQKQRIREESGRREALRARRRRGRRDDEEQQV
ncbi:MAG: metallopeptidase family protein [Oscillospiraceae bacterium]